MPGGFRASSGADMHRWTLLVFCFLFVAAAAILFVMAGKPNSAQAVPGLAAASASPAHNPSVAAGTSNEATEPSDVPADATGVSMQGDAGVPELPKDAPKNVGFGVILVQYVGAQLAPKDGRAKTEALGKAQALAKEAAQDFDQAVRKGDRGSTADAGNIPRGILEPAIEYVLFSLEQGAVHPEPIDTPRGYWVVRRVR